MLKIRRCYNISKYVDRVKVIGVMNFMSSSTLLASVADALCPFDRVTSFAANLYPTK